MIKEITFIAYEAEEGGYYARAVEQPIFTQADTLEDLRVMIKDAVDCHFDEGKPKLVNLHLSHNEVFALS
jgi:predicted RNase H-like HicB family nuclease